MSDCVLVSDIPQRFVFVETVVSILQSKLHQFWKLGQSYVNGQLSSKPNLHREDEIGVCLANELLAGLLDY